MSADFPDVPPWQRRVRLRLEASAIDAEVNAKAVSVAPTQVNPKAVSLSPTEEHPRAVEVSPTEVNSEGAVSSPGSETETVLDGCNGKATATIAVDEKNSLPSSSSRAAEPPSAAVLTTSSASRTTASNRVSGQIMRRVCVATFVLDSNVGFLFRCTRGI